MFGKEMIENLTVHSPKISSTGFGGGHAYLVGEADWKEKRTPVFVFLKDKKEEEKLESMTLTETVCCRAESHDYVEGHGLSLHNGTINQTPNQSQ
jgi:hypothetical protein